MVVRAFFIAVALVATALMSAVAQQGDVDKRAALEQAFAYSDAAQCHTAGKDNQEDGIVGQLVAAHGLPGIDKQVVLAALEAAVARKCDMNERDYHAGLTPLQMAILFNDADMVQFLLEHGADVHAKAKNSGTEFDGMDAPAFLNYVLDKDAKHAKPADRSKVQALLAAAQKAAKS